jgi:hypothetical protein
VKLDLPDDHPIAKAIRDLTHSGWPPGQLILSLDHFSHAGHKRIFALDIDAWTATTNTEQRFELELTDHAERVRELEAMLKWSEPCIDTD